MRVASSWAASTPLEVSEIVAEEPHEVRSRGVKCMGPWSRAPAQLHPRLKCLSGLLHRSLAAKRCLSSCCVVSLKPHAQLQMVTLTITNLQHAYVMISQHPLDGAPASCWLCVVLRCGLHSIMSGLGDLMRASRSCCRHMQ